MIPSRHLERDIIDDKFFSNLRKMIENRARCLYPNISPLFLLPRFTLSLVIADHKFDVPFTRRRETNNCFQKMGMRLILMIVEANTKRLFLSFKRK